ncbi:VOC family protein [Kribbella sp. NPDC051952]|uniref:VOC family protein n=1 Tax=Kribbella sp. NPDC051952 TaxID=3154851 RepID=UPI0034310660
MEQKLVAVVVPVSDLDRSRHFYRALGFRLDEDRAARGSHRMVRLTPPGSSCSIILSTDTAPGATIGVLTVADLGATLAELESRGARPSAIAHCADGSDYATFPDPDGNKWLLVSS